MAKVYQSISSWIYKSPANTETEVPVQTTEVKDANNVKENDSPEIYSDKKTDEIIEPTKQPGIIWRLGSGVYSTTAGAVGAGVTGVKWVAEKGYNAGAVVVNTGATVVKKVPLPAKKKAKDD